MRSQLPEHTLVTLLRQCFVTPRCQVLRQSATRSSKLFHTSPSYEGRTLSATGAQHRRIHTRDGPPDDLRTQFTSIEPSYPLDNVLRAQSKAPKAIQHQKLTPEQNIAVIGAGITGLATAYFLTKEMNNATVTIYETFKEGGGWIKSLEYPGEDGDVIFELGPRNLRPNTPAALVTIKMIRDLGLEDELLITPKDSPAATSRFIYYPDHLVKMPGPGQNFYDMAWSVLTEDVFSGFVKSLLEYLREPREFKNDLDDESIGSFLERRLGSRKVGDNIVSAVLHGIYAGDIYKLSVKSLAPLLWHYEKTAGSLSKALIDNTGNGWKTIAKKDQELILRLKPQLQGPLMDRIGAASVYTFKGGLQTLTIALEKVLRANPKVQFKATNEVSDVQYDKNADCIKVKTEESPVVAEHTHCISTIRAMNLARITPEHGTDPVKYQLESLQDIPYVTVMVVNLFYRDPSLLPEAGFGYLIPRSISFDQNPERALGVIFDSYSSVGQDTAPGTKITVMLGGHWWDDFEDYPSREEGIEMAKAVLKRHLKIDDEPDRTFTFRSTSCIPQYTVGHDGRLGDAHSALMKNFNGKLSVAGNWIDGVGVNDCVRGASDLVDKLKAWGGNGELGMVTGLEDFTKPREWVQVKTEQRLRMERKMQERE